MAPAVPQIAELVAPASWRTVDFISDIHLQAGEPATFNAWKTYLEGTTADALFILGDLFDAWVGDDAVGTVSGVDAAPNFDAQCAQVLQAAGARMALYVMHGNRDFLIGPQLMAQCNGTLLADPTVLTFASRRWLLSHGDALCVDDVDYMRFREQVRGSEWQQAFLAQPLAARQAVARGLRQKSRQQHDLRRQSGAPSIDVDGGAARQWLQAANAPVLIHGHTHQPAVHALGAGLERVVLSDWDAADEPPRAQLLRLDASGLQRVALA